MRVAKTMTAQRWNLLGSLLLAWNLATTNAFVLSTKAPVVSSQISMTATTDVTELGCTTESRENYDIVKVDLSDGRDYPIYIGTGYSDDEGKRCLRI